MTVSPVRDETERVVGASAVARDITDRRRAYEASAYLASIVESSDDAIIGKTLDGTIVSWNAGAERLYGYTPEEAIGQPISMLVSDSRDDEVPQILAELAAGRSVEHYETIRRRKDGSRVDVSLTVSPIRDATGNVTGASAVARDITDRRRAEEARRAQALELNDDVVQGLVAAQYAFELGRAEEAERSVRATLAAARRIVADLFGSRASRPGDFQRSRPTELG